jgi:LacI family transcriptional regulator
LSEVSSDATNVARMAIEHLLQRGLRHFAYVGFENRPWSLRRGDAFAQQLRAIGYAPHFYCPPKSIGEREWEFEIKLMADWLRTLPVPVGLFACNDDRGRQVLEASRLAQLVVPEDIAVLGVDNDTVLCELVDPPLSSIALGAEAAGYRAAELLDGMMRGLTTKPQRIIVEPIRVVARRSTHNFAVDDPDVAAALKYIHQTQGRAISVSQVADVTAMSRRNLERKFRETIGRSVLQELQLVRLEHAKKLLLETTHPISAISQMSGFGSRSYFNQFFRHSVGLTPRQFRMQFKT